MTRPPIPPAPFAGGCLCGAVRYSIAQRPMAVNACHCTDCKHLSGGTHGIFLHVPRATLTLEQGTLARYRKTADSGRQLDIARCAACGTRLWHEPLAAPTLMFVAPGTLDEPDWAIPTSHIWASRMAPGVAVEPDAAVYDGAPTDRQELWDRFAEIYPNG